MVETDGDNDAGADIGAAPAFVSAWKILPIEKSACLIMFCSGALALIATDRRQARGRARNRSCRGTGWSGRGTAPSPR